MVKVSKHIEFEHKDTNLPYAFFEESSSHVRCVLAKVSDNICVKRTKVTKFFPFLDERNVSRECRTGHADITPAPSRSRGDCAKWNGHAMSAPRKFTCVYTRVPGPLLDYIQHLCSAHHNSIPDQVRTCP